MKLFIIIVAVTLAQAAKLDRTYLPPNAQQSSGSAFLQTPRESRFQAQPTAYSADAFAQNNGNINAYNNFVRQERPQAAYERNAAILRQDNDNDGERYAYAYETENGIYAEENGVATNGVQAQGGFTYTGDDGKVYSIRYTADENGFIPQGDHLPTPPPVPEEILKSLEQNARNEAAGIYDDGSYNEAKNNGIAQQYYNSNAQPINYNAPITAQDAIITNAAISRTSGNARALSLQTPEKAYLPPFAQRISNAQDTTIYRTPGSGRALTGGAPQKAYLPPSVQRVTSNIDDAVVTNSAISRTSANARSFPVGAPQKAYLPPSAQRVTSNEDDAVVTNSAISRTSANARSFPEGAPQKAYLPPSAQRVTSNEDAVVTNSAISLTSANGRSFPVGTPQKAYLPPTQRIANQRTAASARQFSFNAREGYRY